MGSIHNTRILRFLIVLATVILTIFIYASYSSNTSIIPPHMRSAGSSQQASPASAALAAAPFSSSSSSGSSSSNSGSSSNNNNNNNIQQQQQQLPKQQYNQKNKIASGSSSSTSNNINNISNHVKNMKNAHASQSAAALLALGVKRPHREPTIDEDAAGGGGGGGAVVGSDDIPDEVALDHFVNNELMMEEQYVGMQNADNLLGNMASSNINTSDAVLSQKQQQQQQHQAHQQQRSDGFQDQQQQQQQQQQQLNIASGNSNNNNNLNKILDSDVLIPTSNLQKFIETADRILKNITAIPPSAVPAAVPAAAEIINAVKSTEQIHKQQPNAVAAENVRNVVNDDDDDDNDNAIENDEALPPSVVMTIKRPSAIVAGAPPIIAKSNGDNKPKMIATRANITTPSAIIDPSQGITTQRIYESGHMNDEIDIGKICPNQGADLRLLIIITSAQAHADARLAIRQTWGHYGVRRDVSTAFILGRTTNETLNLALTQENFIYGDLIRGHFVDSYNNLTLKTISSLEWVDEHCPRAKYILKTDDDMFINVPKLLTFLDHHSKDKRVIYGRLAKKWKPIRNKKSKYYVSTGQFSAPVFPPFTTGPAYVMSGDIIHELYVRSLHQVYLKLEDVFTTGIVAQMLGIKRVHVNEFLNRRIAFNPCNIRKTISVHMIKSNEQFDLWKKLLDQTTKCK